MLVVCGADFVTVCVCGGGGGGGGGGGMDLMGHGSRDGGPDNWDIIHISRSSIFAFFVSVSSSCGRLWLLLLLVW